MFLFVSFFLWKLRPLGHSLCFCFSFLQFPNNLESEKVLQLHCCCGSLPWRQTALDQVTNKHSINQGTGALTLWRFEQVGGLQVSILKCSVLN